MHLLHASPTAPWAVLAGIIIMVLLVSGSFATIARVFKVLVPRSSRTLRCYFSCADSTSGVDHPPRPRLLTMSDAQNARRTDRSHRALQMPATTDFDGAADLLEDFGVDEAADRTKSIGRRDTKLFLNEW